MKIEAGCDTELQRIFAALTWVDVHTLPWAWCVKRIPSRTRCWVLHHLFRVGFRLAWICIASRRLTGATRARQSLAADAVVALLRVISRPYARRVLGNIERYRQSVLSSEETGTGTFNAAHWAVWDASDLRDNFL